MWNYYYYFLLVDAPITREVNPIGYIFIILTLVRQDLIQRAYYIRTLIVPQGSILTAEQILPFYASRSFPFMPADPYLFSRFRDAIFTILLIISSLSRASPFDIGRALSFYSTTCTPKLSILTTPALFFHPQTTALHSLLL